MTFEAYINARTALIQKDRALRRDRSQDISLTEMDKKAEEIIRHVRAQEAKAIWDVEHDEIPHVFPGMEFLTGSFPANLSPCP